LFGGKAAWKNVMTAVAWTFVFYVAKLVIWLLSALSFGEETFTLYTPNIDSSFFLLLLYFFFLTLDMILTVWFYITLFLSVAEAHQFSFWKGTLTVILGIALLWLVLKYVFHTVIMPL
jgi:signal peptidase I